MTFRWEFTTEIEEYDVKTLHEPCHKGPMIPLEEVIAKPFVHMHKYNLLRERLLVALTTTDNTASKTRELLLRVLNSDLKSLFSVLTLQRNDLQTRICGKRRATAIDTDLKHINHLYQAAGQDYLTSNGGLDAYKIIKDSLESSNVITRVIGKCALILLVALKESSLSA